MSIQMEYSLQLSRPTKELKRKKDETINSHNVSTHLFTHLPKIIMKSSTVCNSFSFLFCSIFVSWSTLLLSHRRVVAFSLKSEGEALLSLQKRFSRDKPSLEAIGINWKTLSTNSSSTPRDHWEGVKCNKQNTHVVSIDLRSHSSSFFEKVPQGRPSHSIPGQLGPEIGRLRYLKSLYLDWSNFNGSIPIELWNCSHLQHLSLSGNNFTGELPEAVGNLHNLKTFSISFNQLTGTLPESLFQISGLEYVRLNRNNFTGSIPLNIGNATKLESLSLHNNGLSGEIPLEVWRIPTLAYIDVSHNNLSGELHVQMTELHHLTHILLNNNHFSGLIPKALGINSTSLKWVDFSNNNFSGKIPSNLCFGKQLITLRLDFNQFHGSIPPSYRRHCYWLYTLSLGGNRLTGTLPHFERNSNLTFFDISRNSVHGKIPSSICNLSSLALLDLSENHMNGTLPHCLGDLKELVTLNLRNNDFSGTISLNFTGNPMHTLDLNGNSFEGKIPRSLIHSPVRYLDLGNNQLNDTFPFFLEMLWKLEILVLRSNKLYGPLTRLAFNKLKVLDISSNYFTGDLPLEFILGLDAMKHIDHVRDIFYEDNLYEPISIVVINKGKEIRLNITLMTTFRAIDMSNNRFQGTIPVSIGELLLLKMLNLSSNKLNGHIPLSLGNLTQLESLDLSENKFFGEIPWQLTNIHFLAVLNLSHNNLTGRIPNAGQFQTFPNTSFDGNPGLCGYQLSRGCWDDTDKESGQNAIEEKESYEHFKFWNFGWEPVVIGYRCGILIGLVIQYFVFTKASMYRWFG